MIYPSRIISASFLALTRQSAAFTSSPPASIARATTTRLFSTAPPTRYLLNYEYIPDVLEKRGPYREGHIGLAKEMIESGTCVSGGPHLIPGDGVPNGGESNYVLKYELHSLLCSIETSINTK